MLTTRLRPRRQDKITMKGKLLDGGRMGRKEGERVGEMREA